MAWEGERTVTFTMEDALISPVSFSILSGAGLIEADSSKPIYVHKTEQTAATTKNTSGQVAYVEIKLSEKPYIKGNGTSIDNNADYIYVMLLNENGEVVSEPYIASEADALTPDADGKYAIRIYAQEDTTNKSDEDTLFPQETTPTATNRKNDLDPFKTGCTVLVDYYVAYEAGAYQIDITPDKFGGNFYLEASTLFRAENGADMPAEFIIPNCKVQSNFTFTMASSGDPSTFTFTMDAFPDYTRWNKDKKVFAAIQVINTGKTNADLERLGTGHDYGKGAGTGGADTDPYATYAAKQQKFVEID